MSIRYKVASLFIGFVALILIVNNVLYWKATKDMLLEENRQEMLSLSQSIAAYIERVGESSSYAEALMSQNLRTAAIAAQALLPSKARDITNEQLKEIAQKVDVDHIMLLQENPEHTDIVSVKATLSKDIGVSTREWGDWHGAFRQLLAMQTVSIEKGQTLLHYWSAPTIDVPDGLESSNKRGYYYDGSTDYIISPYMDTQSVEAYNRRFNPEDVLQVVKEKSSHFLEYTIFNTDAMDELEYPLMTGTDEYRKLESPTVLTGTYQYAFKGADISAIKYALEGHKWTEYQTEVAGRNIFKTFYPIKIDGKTYVVSIVLDYEAVEVELFHQTKLSILLSIIVLVGLIPISILFSASITNPIQRIVQKVQDISKGNYGQQLSFKRKDELGMLMLHVNEMASHIQQYTYDLAESKRQAEREAYYDTLTGLPNRHHLHKFLKQCENDTFAVLFLDADHFKLINDLRGHHIGDELIRQLGQRLRSVTPDHVFVARQGGDEFVVVVPHALSLEEISPLAESIVQEMRKTFILAGKEHDISVSIGYSLYSPELGDIEQFLRHADIAMYDAKRRGGNQAVSYQIEESDVERELAMQERIYTAIRSKSFDVYFQPKIDLLTGRIVGVEALARWNDEELGVISPDKFIPLAERLGVMMPLWEIVMEKACMKVAYWQTLGYHISVAVNFSATQFRHADELVQRLCVILGKYDLHTNSFEVEITESALMKQGTKPTLAQIQKLGIKVAVDDFGTGYSSLSYLDDFPIDYLKIDRSFIQGLHISERKEKIVEAVIKLAHKLQLKVVAEGVETEEQKKQLKQWSCDEVQGFLFSKPLPAHELEKLLSRSFKERV